MTTESKSDTKAEAESEQTGTFLIVAADEESAVLEDVRPRQVHVLPSSPGVSEDEAVRRTVVPGPSMDILWQLMKVESRQAVSVGRSTESPTTNSRGIAASNPDGELVREKRAGTSEIHVLSVPSDMTEQAVDDILDDREGLFSRAARFDMNRVEIRS